MKFVRHGSIKRKLMLIILFTAFVAVLLFSTGLIFVYKVSAEKNLTSRLNALAGMLAVQSTAAVTFNDREMARQILSTISQDAAVETACIYTANGAEFAVHSKSGLGDCPNHGQRPGAILKGGDLLVAQPILLRQNNIGSLYLVASTGEVARQVLWFLLMILLVSIPSALVAYWLARRLRRSITRPLIRLKEVTEGLSEDTHYEYDLSHEANDEIGALYDSFSVMTERVKEREVARDLALRENAAKTSYLTSMSHEIRTPMNAIMGLTHLLQGDSPSPEQSQKLDKINSAAKHLLAIINDIMDLAKIEAGKLSLECADFQLSEVFEQVQLLTRDQAEEKSLVFEASYDGVPDWLNGDTTRLKQAVLNYVSNAIKFSENGVIRLRARTIDEKPGSCCIKFEVEDEGIGIEASKLDSLFDTFEQADASTARIYGGTGLGLAINKHLATLMDGQVGVESAVGKGSTFWFTAWLEHGSPPVEVVAPKSLEDVKAELRIKGTGAPILLVEDNDVNREVALVMLQDVALDVTIACDGLEALEVMKNRDFDLVLMDVQMPRMNGLEATRVIRETIGSETLPILAMTANVFAEDRQACLEAGMNDFVPKPFKPEDLYQKILQWL